MIFSLEPPLTEISQVMGIASDSRSVPECAVGKEGFKPASRVLMRGLESLRDSDDLGVPR
jgi:hypothetical protein